MNLKNYITVVQDWPKEGIAFKDITSLMSDGPAYKFTVDQISNFALEKNADIIVGPEARGFIIGCPVAYKLNVGFVPVRKEGKLPRKTINYTYDLEYGTSSLSIHEDAIQKGTRVIITDDLLATGGTIGATIKLVEKLGGIVVGIAFIIELDYLKGRTKLVGYDVMSLISYN